MVKETKQRKSEKKKPTMTLKERRAKKHEKRQQKYEHRVGIQEPLTDQW